MALDNNDIFGDVKETFDSLGTFQFQPGNDSFDISQEIDDLKPITVSDDEANDEVNKEKPKRKPARSQKNKRKNVDDYDIEYVPDEPIKVTRSKSRRRISNRLKQSKALENDCCIINISSPPRVSRERIRGNANKRGGSRTSRRGRTRTNTSIITYSIGNTSEYPDELEDVPMFNMQCNDVIELDDSVNVENHEMSVKVEWQSVEIFKFSVRKLQHLKQIYEFFCEKYNVGQDNLLFMYNNKILQPEDTPDSIGYREAKLIDGGIVYKNKIKAQNNKDVNSEKVQSGIEIKLQYQSSRHPFIVHVQNDETLLLAMTKCSEKLGVLLNKLKFEFDGDIVSGKQTPNSLGLEGGECIDVKIIK